MDTFHSRSKHGPVERAFCVETQCPAAPIEGTETSSQIVQPIETRVQGVMAELVIAQGVNGRAVTVNIRRVLIRKNFSCKRTCFPTGRGPIQWRSLRHIDYDQTAAACQAIACAPCRERLCANSHARRHTTAFSRAIGILGSRIDGLVYSGVRLG